MSRLAVAAIATDTWVKGSWEEFYQLTEDADHGQGRFYYDREHIRIETSPLGSAHGQDNSIISNVVTLFATLNHIRIKQLINTSFWKVGVQACQPDIAVYIGPNFKFPPPNNSAISVSEYGAPTLVIEIGATSFQDDLGVKRLLYEQLGVREYWVVNVADREVIAFEVDQGHSGRIQASQVLSGLQLVLVEEVLQRSQTDDDGAINRWLIQTFSQSD